jgi:hypothetical protein
MPVRLPARPLEQMVYARHHKVKTAVAGLPWVRQSPVALRLEIHRPSSLMRDSNAT